MSLTPQMNAIGYAYWCGRFMAIAEAVSGEFPVSQEAQQKEAVEALKAFRAYKREHEAGDAA